ncbi:MAG: hypothetical protein QM687_03070 [Ferruginibacter sp.]
MKKLLLLALLFGTAAATKAQFTALELTPKSPKQNGKLSFCVQQKIFAPH